MAIGFLGGTFDPVHRGHLQLGDSAVAHLGLESVLFVPTGRPWLKAGQYLSPAMASFGNGAGEPLRVIRGSALCDVEVDRPGPDLHGGHPGGAGQGRPMVRR